MLKTHISTKVGLIILAAILAVCVGVLFFLSARWDFNLSFEPAVPGIKITKDIFDTDAGELKKFVSSDEFKKYLADNQSEQGYYGIGLGGARDMMVSADFAMESSVNATAPKTAPMPEAGMGGTADRVSETNVQVAGIDEPDIVKTDGKEIYFSRSGGYYPWRDTPGIMMEKAIMPYPDYNQGKTDLILAFPPDSMKKDSTIEQGGNLLLNDNTLIVFSNDQKIFAYDVTNKAEPKEKWTAKLGDRESLINARLMNGKIYLATRHGINYENPCPIIPMTVGDNEISISCADIYYPTKGGYADATYNFMVMDVADGKVEKKTSFVGSSGQTVFYMSAQAIFLTYPVQIDSIEIAYKFFAENSDIVPSWVIERLNKVRSYDLSPSAKSAELYSIIERYRNSLNNDQMLKMENEMTNRMEKFYTAHRRSIGKTGVIKVSLDNFSAIVGEVPGAPLNQFSLDEYDNHLRIAVTIGQSWWGIAGFGSSGKTVSDVYVLDKNLKTVGAVKDLGETERIYSVRFIEDRGYVVTFRQIDPFYVLDLSSHSNPVMRGELKIPGYSSYLHPLAEHKVLGIGKDENKVKLSIFDTTRPEDPKEADKYLLNEYWSEALDNHRAFLQDKKHQVFFIPGSQGGYVFSYVGDKLKLETAISGSNILRAIYLDDNMYLIGTEKIIVLDEKTWEKIKEFDL
jgi:uncharacterized secreted protein with C-terminal beta-propeller domain